MRYNARAPTAADCFAKNKTGEQKNKETSLFSDAYMLLPAARNYLLAFYKLAITPITVRYLIPFLGLAVGILGLHDIAYTLTSNLKLENFSFLSLCSCRMLYLASTTLSIRRGFNCRFTLSRGEVTVLK